MTYDRDEDILYLAHQLWEEADVPTSAACAYWKEAALQVLARGGERNQAQGGLVAFSPCKTNGTEQSLILSLTSAKHGRAICIDAHGQSRVTFTVSDERAVAANNSLISLVRKVD